MSTLEVYSLGVFRLAQGPMLRNKVPTTTSALCRVEVEPLMPYTTTSGLWDTEDHTKTIPADNKRTF